MIVYNKGDLLSTPDVIIVHGCNAHGAMNSGVAKAIREKYPRAYEDYRKTYQIHMRLELGDWIRSIQHNGKIIINAITQDGYGYDGKKYVSYDAIDKVCIRLAETIAKESSFSMPRIGAGLGGGDWNVIEAIINHRLKEHTVNVWTLE